MPPRKPKTDTGPGPLINPPRSRYTGKTGNGGEPCSDCHHDRMYLPEGQPYAAANWLCSTCHKPAGYHHRTASCGPPGDIADAHPLRIVYDDQRASQ